MHRRLPALLLVAAVVLASLALVWAVSQSGPRGLVSFASHSDLIRYLDSLGSEDGTYRGIDLGFGGLFPPAGLLTGPGSEAQAGDVPSFSGTNVQVAGVDEIDFVKTDGTYAYLVSGQEVVIVRAWPADAMSVVARIGLEGLDPDGGDASALQVAGIFVDGDRLAVVASTYSYGTREGGLFAPEIVYGRGSTVLGIFDLSTIEAPALLRTHGLSGSFLTARMIPPYVYLVSNEYVTKVEEVYLLPEVCDGDACEVLPAADIRYDPESEDASSFTNILAASLLEDAHGVLSVVTGYTSTLYMSPAALYLTFAKWEDVGILAESSLPQTWTSIHQVLVDGVSIDPAASGDVPGTLLNQFSLDEYAGHLRVATTSWTETGSESNVYVLDGSLQTVGRLEGLAPGEHIYSARFLGDRAYLVTFEKIDPFFAIDLSDPAAPRVLGSLKIPGYSDYLHPFDEDHVLGIGKDAIPDEDWNFSWYQGLKLSLFNVTDVEQPTELDRVEIGDRGTESEALHEHKAFLFLRERGLIVLPVSLARIDPEAWGGTPPPYAYGEIVWVGAYVIRATLDGGFEIVGRISHMDTPDPYAYYYGAPGAIRRSFAIGDVLYTVSGEFLKANALEGLAELGVLDY